MIGLWFLSETAAGTLSIGIIFETFRDAGNVDKVMI